MNEPEKFLGRWSRRKRQAEDQSAPVEPKDAAKSPTPDNETKEAVAEAAFDPASLPPLESITAESDIRAFLKPGVPPDLTRAALRRAWSADPAIRDFIGLVENGWDFNDPYGVPGFGPMPVGEDIARLLAQAIGARPAEKTPPSDPLKEPDSPTKPLHGADLDRPPEKQEPASPENESVQRSENIATQNDSDDAEVVPPAPPRGHGGALPK